MITKKEYDRTIEQHYQDVAKEHGLSAASTMSDEITRDLETDAITQFVGESLRLRQIEGSSGKATIMDVGCGNGYTLDVLSNKYPDQNYVGIEKSDELRSLASSRFVENNNVKIFEGDIRDKDFAKTITADILISQRVLVNLLEKDDQKLALHNIINAVNSPNSWRSGGTLLFVECFLSPLARLNDARSEFDLQPISPAHHNLYLPDDFFEIPRLKPLQTDRLFTPPHFLSTHYYVTRVLHPIFTHDKPFKRNSEFVRFFSYALNQNAGDYSPLKLYMFEKTEEAQGLAPDGYSTALHSRR